MDILMPRLGLTMETGVIIKWHIAVGDTFIEEDPLFDVESDKLTNTVNARFNGELTEILVQDGEEAEVAAVVAKAKEV